MDDTMFDRALAGSVRRPTRRAVVRALAGGCSAGCLPSGRSPPRVLPSPPIPMGMGSMMPTRRVSTAPILPPTTPMGMARAMEKRSTTEVIR